MPAFAQVREQEMANRGDVVGQAAWRALAGAIELLKRKDAAGGRMH